MDYDQSICAIEEIYVEAKRRFVTAIRQVELRLSITLELEHGRADEEDFKKILELYRLSAEVATVTRVYYSATNNDINTDSLYPKIVQTFEKLESHMVRLITR